MSRAAVSFATLLKQYRKTAGLTQEELAERADLSARAISDLERGVKRHPYPHTARQLVEALQLDGETAAHFLHAALAGEATKDAAGESMGRVAPSSSLPTQLTPFIGRRHELRELRAALSQQSVRLLTLTGPGGAGKTRLAVQVAEDVSGHFPDGVFFVSLGSLGDPSRAPPSIASALGIREMPGAPILDVLTTHLRSKKLLLVLDNLEHLLPATDAVSHLLASCAQITILVTSRTVLHLGAEREYPVPPLTLPSPGYLPGLADLARYDAIRLFVQRAVAARPAFRLTDENASAVARICYRLDGLPLAIELAASRIKLFPPQALHEQLSGSLRLLTGGARDLPARQQTLRNTIEWSYSLLSAEEQRLFARLSVFAGGCSLVAAEAICNPEGEIDLVEGLASLIDHSLLRQDGEEEPRIAMLQTLREYASEQLAAQGERDACQRRHAVYYVALGDRAEPQLTGREQLRWLDLLEREHDNLRVALGWCLARSDHGEDTLERGEMGLRLAASLHWFWLFRDHHREGLAWLEHALARGAAAADALRAKALCNAGVLAGLVPDLTKSETLLTQSVSLSREAGDQRRLSMALAVLGSTSWGSDSDGSAIEALEESLTLARGIVDPWLIGHALIHTVFSVANTAAITLVDERVRAWAAGEEGLSLFRSAGDAVAAAVLQLSLGRIALYAGDYVRARTAFVACLPTLHALGWGTTIGDALVGLGDAAREQGDGREAAAAYSEAATLYRSAGDRLAAALARALSRLAETNLELDDWAAADISATESLAIARDTGEIGSSDIVRALGVHAALAAIRRMPARALRLGGAAAAIRHCHAAFQDTPGRHARERPLTYLPPSFQPRDVAAGRQTLERLLAVASEALSADEQAAAWAEGQSLSVEQAIACALDGT